MGGSSSDLASWNALNRTQAFPLSEMTFSVHESCHHSWSQDGNAKRKREVSAFFFFFLFYVYFYHGVGMSIFWESPPQTLQTPLHPYPDRLGMRACQPIRVGECDRQSGKRGAEGPNSLPFSILPACPPVGEAARPTLVALPWGVLLVPPPNYHPGPTSFTINVSLQFSLLPVCFPTWAWHFKLLILKPHSHFFLRFSVHFVFETCPRVVRCMSPAVRILQLSWANCWEDESWDTLLQESECPGQTLTTQKPEEGHWACGSQGQEERVRGRHIWLAINQKMKSMKKRGRRQDVCVCVSVCLWVGCPRQLCQIQRTCLSSLSLD